VGSLLLYKDIKIPFTSLFSAAGAVSPALFRLDGIASSESFSRGLLSKRTIPRQKDVGLYCCRQ